MESQPVGDSFSEEYPNEIRVLCYFLKVRTFIRAGELLNYFSILIVSNSL